MPPDMFETPMAQEKRRYPVAEAELEHVSPPERGGGNRNGEIEERLQRISSYQEQISGLMSRIDEEKESIRKMIGR